MTINPLARIVSRMNTSPKRRGRPLGTKSLILVSLGDLQEVLKDGQMIPISVTFARQLGFASQNNESVSPKLDCGSPISIKEMSPRAKVEVLSEF